MPAEQPYEVWVNVFEVLGLAFTGGAFAWVRSYLKGRAEEADHRPDLPARAIGAAFVDRSVADAMVGMAEDVKVIRKLAEQRRDRAAEKSVMETAVRVAREEAERVSRRRHEDGD